MTVPWPLRIPALALGCRYVALLMFSNPPATITRLLPPSYQSFATMTAFSPDPHILLTVVAPVESASPAPILAWRAAA